MQSSISPRKINTTETSLVSSCTETEDKDNILTQLWAVEEGRDTLHTQQGELLNLFLIAQEEGRPENNAASLKILEENGSQSRVLYPVYIYI